MLKLVSEVLGSKVVDFESGQTIGEITNWIVDPDTKKISSFVVKRPGLLSAASALTTIDVIEYGPNLVVVRNQHAIVPPHEVAGLPKLMKAGHRVIGGSAQTQSGRVLGVVENVLFETNDSTIQKVYVRPRIIDMVKYPDLVISADKIIRIEPRRMIFSDEVNGPSTQRTAMPSQA
jgi:uncharacterized protein YrrD